MLETFKAKATKLPEGLVVKTDVRNFTISFDEPEELGGTDQFMNPVEGILCALGACQSIVASAFAEAHGVKFEEFSVEVEGDLDPDGFMGLADVRPGFQEIRFVMHFKSNDSQEKLEAYADFIESVCPVGDCLANGVKLVRSGVKID